MSSDFKTPLRGDSPYKINAQWQYRQKPEGKKSSIPITFYKLCAPRVLTLVVFNLEVNEKHSLFF